MKLLSARAKIENAQNRLRLAVEIRKPQLLPTTIGYQSGSFATDVMWLPSLGFWAYFGMPPNEKSPSERYWNVFGSGKPKNSASITCEINPPIDGINRRVSGAFAETESGVALLHRGRLNVSGGITKEFFVQHYRGKWVEVEDGEKISSLVYIGDLDSLDLCEEIGKFVRQVARIKNLARR